MKRSQGSYSQECFDRLHSLPWISQAPLAWAEMGITSRRLKPPTFCQTLDRGKLCKCAEPSVVWCSSRHFYAPSRLLDHSSASGTPSPYWSSNKVRSWSPSKYIFLSQLSQCLFNRPKTNRESPRPHMTLPIKVLDYTQPKTVLWVTKSYHWHHCHPIGHDVGSQIKVVMSH